MWFSRNFKIILVDYRGRNKRIKRIRDRDEMLESQKTKHAHIPAENFPFYYKALVVFGPSQPMPKKRNKYEPIPLTPDH